MVKYATAALVIISTAKLGVALHTSSAFLSHHLPNHRKIISSTSSSNLRREFSAIPFDGEFADNENNEGAGISLPSATSLLENIPEDNQEYVDALLAKKEERRVARLQRTRKPNYQITLPISGGSLIQPPPQEWDALASLVAKGQEIAVANTIGMSLRQVYSGRKISELALDVDTLRFQSFVDELQGRSLVCEDGDVECEMEAELLSLQNSFGSVQVLQNSAVEMLTTSFDGVVVSSVAIGGLAWNAGVRAGDVLTATSATMGAKLWPKSTLDGIRSAISSRKVMSSTMGFEFRHMMTDDANGSMESVKSFELALSRPIGINVEDTDDGYVTITGISDKAAFVVKDNLSIGDRVVSVESSVGGQMWDVSSTDGLTSAVTSRLPGQQVRILFERVEVMEEGTAVEELPVAANSGSISDAVIGFRQAGKSVSSEPASAATQTLQAATQTAAQKMLLSRSRDLLRTYMARNEVTKNVKVADRVIEAVIDAGAVLDGKTLNLIMKAYNTCDNADKAIGIFEEVFGLAGDGTEREVTKVHDGKLAADISALNIFTISALLRAHAVRGDYESALLVLAAVEGKTDFTIKGKKSYSWSGKGDPLNMLPDTRTYNIAIAAAAKQGTKDGLKAPLDIFESMPDPSLNNPLGGKPAKNLVTYNTMIDVFANAGLYQEAEGVFKSLKKSVLRPDIVSYTTLIKAAIKSGNTEKGLDLLDDMKWSGIQPDIVSYNSIIESLCKSNRLFEAKDLVNEMEMTRVSPDSMTYGLLMNGLLKANKPGPCLTLYESACSDERTAGLMENVQLYTTAISAAAALGDHERALDYVSRMNRAGVRPNKKTLTALMGACIAGKKFDAAADIFSKIKNPDSYAISVGLDALCLAGKFDAALELITDQRSGQKTLKGKQVMTGYNKLIEGALYAGELNVARDALTGLLQAGYIPSKFTFGVITDGLNLQSDLSYSSSSLKKTDSQPSDGNFEFLLFVLDSLESRKLTIDSAFYSAILLFGSQTGGLHKRIASLLTRSRKSGMANTQKQITLSDEDCIEEICTTVLGWEDLLQNYAEYKKEDISSIIFPTVRVSSKGFGRVLAAEQAVNYRAAAAQYSR